MVDGLVRIVRGVGIAGANVYVSRPVECVVAVLLLDDEVVVAVAVEVSNTGRAGDASTDRHGRSARKGACGVAVVNEHSAGVDRGLHNKHIGAPITVDVTLSKGGDV